MAEPKNHGAAATNGNINVKQDSPVAAVEQHEDVLEGLLEGLSWLDLHKRQSSSSSSRPSAT